MNTVTITRRSRNIGWGVNVTATQGEYGLYVKEPTKPDFVGTLKQVFTYISLDPFYRSLQQRY